MSKTVWGISLFIGRYGRYSIYNGRCSGRYSCYSGQPGLDRKMFNAFLEEKEEERSHQKHRRRNLYSPSAIRPPSPITQCWGSLPRRCFCLSGVSVPNFALLGEGGDRCLWGRISSFYSLALFARLGNSLESRVYAFLRWSSPLCMSWEQLG